MTNLLESQGIQIFLLCSAIVNLLFSIFSIILSTYAAIKVVAMGQERIYV